MRVIQKLFLIPTLSFFILLFSCSDNSTGPGGSSIYKIVFSLDIADNEQNDIYSINPDGTKLNRLTYASETSSNDNPIWSPDGQYVYYKDFMDEQNEIFRMNADDGLSKTNLTQYTGLDRLCDISPDGTKMLFVSDRNQDIFDIYVMDLGTSALTNITDGQESIGRSAYFNPDGQKILYSVIASGFYDLCLENINGTGRTLLGNYAYDDFDGVVSPNGLRIAYVSSPDGSDYYSVWICDIDGNNRVKIGTSETGDFQPNWSPNSQKIAYTEIVEASISNIIVINFDGTEQVCLTDSTNMCYSPKWSPNGAKIAYIERVSGSSELFIMNSDGSEKLQLSNTLGNGYVYNLNWSPAL